MSEPRKRGWLRRVFKVAAATVKTLPAWWFKDGSLGAAPDPAAVPVQLVDVSPPVQSLPKKVSKTREPS